MSGVSLRSTRGSPAAHRTGVGDRDGQPLREFLRSENIAGSSFWFFLVLVLPRSWGSDVRVGLFWLRLAGFWRGVPGRGCAEGSWKGSEGSYGGGVTAE